MYEKQVLCYIDMTQFQQQRIDLSNIASVM